MGETGRLRRSRRQIQAEGRRIGDADFLAGQVIDHDTEPQRPLRIREGRRQRQHHLALVAEGLQAEDGKPLRRRPGDADAVQIRRRAPVRMRRIAGVTGRAPVDLPAVLEAEMKARRNRRAAPRGARGGNQAHRRVIGRGPRRRSRRCGTGRRTRDHGGKHRDHHEKKPIQHFPEPLRPHRPRPREYPRAPAMVPFIAQASRQKSAAITHSLPSSRVPVVSK